MATFVVCALLSACAASPVLQIASFAVDGVAFLATGKGSTDHALSAVTDADCRLTNAVRGRDLCSPWDEGKVPAVAAAFAEASPRAEIAALSADEFHAGRSGIAISFQQSPGMNLAEVKGAPLDAGLEGRLDAAGTLHVYLTLAGEAPGATPLFSVPGYARTPGTFTGVVMGARFFAPESFIR